MKFLKVNIKAISTVTLFLVTVLFLYSFNFSPSVYAETQKMITKTAEFTTLNDEVPEYNDFEQIIDQDGNKYQLKSINYKEMSSEKKENKETKTVTDTKDNLTSKQYSLDENADYFTKSVKDGEREYTATLKSVNYDNNTMTNRTATVSGVQNLGYYTSQPETPQTMQLTYYDAPTDKNYTVNAPLTEVKTSGNSWIDAQYIDITVYNYTSTQYMFGDQIIHHNGDTVMPSEKYNLILDMAGYNTNLYKIKKVYWTSEPYDNGPIKNRNARADLQAYASYYTSYYGQSIKLDDIPSYTAHLEYEYEAITKTITVHKYKAIANYQPVEEVTEPKTTEKTIIQQSAPVVITVSIFFALAILTVLIIALILAKRKKKKGGDVITKG